MIPVFVDRDCVLTAANIEHTVTYNTERVRRGFMAVSHHVAHCEIQLDGPYEKPAINFDSTVTVCIPPAEYDGEQYFIIEFTQIREIMYGHESLDIMADEHTVHQTQSLL